MIIAERKPVPIYEAECTECKSKIQYKKSEVAFTSYITCPVCGISIWADTIRHVRYEEREPSSMPKEWWLGLSKKEVEKNECDCKEIFENTTDCPCDNCEKMKE